MDTPKYTKEQLEAYLKYSEDRLTETASAWMKTEVRKGIELAKAELAKLQAEAEDDDFDYVMTVCEEFNKTATSDKYVGDIGDGMDNEGKMSLCLALNTSKGDGFGYQVGFERVNGIWTLVVWETLQNRCDGVTVASYASNATGSDNAHTVASELARLIEMIATN